MKKTTVLSILSIIITIYGYGQEYLFDIGNPILKEYSKIYFNKNSQKNSQNILLDLPFYDDFSNSFVYPDSTKWVDKYAFVNQSYAKNPINVGVITLDAINQYGDVYPYLPSHSSAIADYLTSQPIKLNVNIEDSVYLSFYYQAGGFGNTPEIKDSLVLQFKTADTDWRSIWRVSGGTNMSNFKLVMIPIHDPLWLKEGFQFRFLNYASVSSNYEPSWISNCDHWHLDNIYLDTARTFKDTLPKDAAFVKNFSSMINNFEAIPWKHFKNYSNPSNLIKDTLHFVYNNTFVNDILNINRKYDVQNYYTSEIIISDYDDNENIAPLSTIDYAKPVNFIFNSTDEDSAKFVITGILGTDVIEQRNIFRWNDTIRYYQNFYNYYAYDDGSAEKGYGISGVNTAYTSLAYRFTPIIADTLKGVYIYFNHVLNNGNQKYFYLTVWNDKNGIPGDTLIRIEGMRPEFNNEINGFIYYSLGQGIYIDTTFYIGWTKTTDDMLNCGFDVNNIANENLFLNITGNWQVSTIPGAIMIRPVFGYEPKIDYVVNHIKNIFNIFPNPAKNKIFIDNIQDTNDITKVEIYDINGKLLYCDDFKTEINISFLDNGLYFLRLVSVSSNYQVKKLIVSK